MTSIPNSIDCARGLLSRPNRKDAFDSGPISFGIHDPSADRTYNSVPISCGSRVKNRQPCGNQVVIPIAFSPGSGAGIERDGAVRAIHEQGRRCERYNGKTDPEQSKLRVRRHWQAITNAEREWETEAGYR